MTNKFGRTLARSAAAGKQTGVVLDYLKGISRNIMWSSTFAMRNAAILLLLCVYGSHSQDFTMGSLNHTLTFIKIGTNAGIPFQPMEDDIYYSDPAHQDIKGIKLQDLEGKDAEAKILAGGVGYHFVNITLKSKPGENLNYQLEIYS